MQAVISGRAGVAIFWEGADLYSLHIGDSPEEAALRYGWEIPYLFGDARDLREFRGSSREQLAAELRFEARQFDSLHLALLVLDFDVSNDLREEAAIELEELLDEDPRYVKFVENVLYSNPLPAAGDLPGALRSAKGTKKASRLFAEFDRLQPQIADVWIAWQSIGEDQFLHVEDRQKALAVAVRSGGFRRLAYMLHRGERVNNYLTYALSDPQVCAIPKHRTIWPQWVNSLQKGRRHLEHVEARWEVAEPALEMHGDGWRSLYLIQAKEKADRQKAVLEKLVWEGNARTKELLGGHLLRLDGTHGESSPVAKFASDFAIGQLSGRFDALPLGVSQSTNPIFLEDSWSWALLGHKLGEVSHHLEASDVLEGVMGLSGASFEGMLRKIEAAIQVAPPHRLIIEGCANELVLTSGLEAAFASHKDMLMRLECCWPRASRPEAFRYAQAMSDRARSGRSDFRDLVQLKEALASCEIASSEIPRHVLSEAWGALRNLDRREVTLASYEPIATLFPQVPLTQRLSESMSLILRSDGGWAASSARDYEWFSSHIRGMILARKGKLEEARELFLEGVRASSVPHNDAYSRSALAAIDLQKNNFEGAAEILAPISGSLQELPVNVLRFHAFGALGRRFEAEKADHLLAEASRSSQVVDLRTEFRRRFLEGRPPARSDGWIWAQELDLLAVA